MFVKCMSKDNCGNLRMRYSFQSNEGPIFVPKRVVVFWCETSKRNEILAPVQKPE